MAEQTVFSTCAIPSVLKLAGELSKEGKTVTLAKNGLSHQSKVTARRKMASIRVCSQRRRLRRANRG